MWPITGKCALNLALTQTLHEIILISTESPDNGSEGGQIGLEKDQDPNIRDKQKSLHFENA